MVKITDTNHYTEVMERDPMGAGDDGTQGFPLSAYYCTPLQPKAAVTNEYKSHGYHYQYLSVLEK
jgi:hypothetical protein